MNPDQMPSTDIVSQIRSTAAGHQTWIERDERGRLWLRCGCGTYTRQPAMAPALSALINHTCKEQ